MSLPLNLSISSLFAAEGFFRSWISGYAEGMLFSGKGICGIGKARNGYIDERSSPSCR